MIYLLQGIPGSGKSTWARERNAVICSADDYFEKPDGYRFDPKKLGDAHAQCMRRFLDALMQGETSIIVDNTNTTQLELAPYYLVARAYNREVTLVRFNIDPKVAHARCVHGVPLDAIQRMRVSQQDPPRFWKIKILSV
jgi:predicted kinase